MQYKRSWTAWKRRTATCAGVTTEVLTLATELRKGTIDRIMAISDLELCLQALLGTLPPGQLLTRPSTLRAIRYRALLRGWAFRP